MTYLLVLPGWVKAVSDKKRFLKNRSAHFGEYYRAELLVSNGYSPCISSSEGIGVYPDAYLDIVSRGIA
jgi:hypothetical protein